MEKLFNNIHYKTICYLLDDSIGYYGIQHMIVPFKQLPSELRVEHTQKDYIKNQGANQIIRGRIKNGKYTFFTGLIPLHNSSTIYFGNNYETIKGQKKTSLVVFVFSENQQWLDIHYFNHFYKESRFERIQFVSDFVKSIS